MPTGCRRASIGCRPKRQSWRTLESFVHAHSSLQPPCFQNGSSTGSLYTLLISHSFRTPLFLSLPILGSSSGLRSLIGRSHLGLAHLLIPQLTRHDIHHGPQSTEVFIADRSPRVVTGSAFVLFLVHVVHAPPSCQPTEATLRSAWDHPRHAFTSRRLPCGCQRCTQPQSSCFPRLVVVKVNEATAEYDGMGHVGQVPEGAAERQVRRSDKWD